jgi:hypothetical protein
VKLNVKLSDQPKEYQSNLIYDAKIKEIILSYENGRDKIINRISFDKRQKSGGRGAQLGGTKPVERQSLYRHAYRFGSGAGGQHRIHSRMGRDQHGVLKMYKIHPE